MNIDKDKFCDEFWKEFCELVPEHLRPLLISCYHVRFMVDAFFTVINRLSLEETDASMAQILGWFVRKRQPTTRGVSDERVD